MVGDRLSDVRAQSKSNESDEDAFRNHFELDGKFPNRKLQRLSKKRVSAGCLGTIKVLQRLRSGKKTTPVSGNRCLMAH